MPKINSFSLCAMVVALSGAPYWGIINAYLFYTSENSVLISMVIGLIISFIATKIFLSIFNKDTNKTIIGKFKIIYGKYSIIVNILYILISFSIYIFLSYRLTAFLSSQYLIETPKIYMHLIVIVTIFYMASKGIEALTRVSVLSLYLSLITFSFIFFSLLKHIEFNNFLPVFLVSGTNILKSSLVFAAYFSIPTFYINSIKKDQIVDKEKFNKTFYVMYFISFIILSISTGITLGVYGIKIANLFDYPLYSVLKKISLFHFIDSIENISMVLWILYVLNASAMVLYSVISAVKETFNINKNRIIIGVLFALAFLIPRILFMKNNFVEQFGYVTYPLSTGLALLLIIFITLVLYKKKKM